MSINYHTFTQCMGSFICSAQTADSSLVHEHFPHWSCIIQVYWVLCSIPTTDQEALGLNIGWHFHHVPQVHFTSLHHWFPYLLGTCLCKSDIKRSPPSHPSIQPTSDCSLIRIAFFTIPVKVCANTILTEGSPEYLTVRHHCTITTS